MQVAGEGFANGGGGGAKNRIRADFDFGFEGKRRLGAAAHDQVPKRLGGGDDADIIFSRLKTDAMGGVGQGVVGAADFVNHSQGLGVLGQEDAAAGDFVDVLDLARAGLHHALGELLIGAFHPVGDHLLLLVGPRLAGAEQAGVFALGEGFGVDAGPVVEAFVDELAADDADGADDGGGVGEDFIARRGQVIPAAGGHRSDADDDGFFLGGVAHRLPHHFAGQRAAAGRIDANDDRLDVLIAGGDAHGFAHVLRTDALLAEQPVPAIPIHDHAAGVDEGNLRLIRLGRRLFHQQREKLNGVVDVHRLARVAAIVVHQIDFIADVLGDDLSQAILVGQFIHQAFGFGLIAGEDRLIDDRFHIIFRDVPMRGDAIDDLLIQAGGELGQFALEFGAGLGAGVFFVGAFVLADLHVVGFYADLIEKAFVECCFQPHAGDHDFASGQEADVLGAGGHGVGIGIVAVGVYIGGLAGLGAVSYTH